MKQNVYQARPNLRFSGEGKYKIVLELDNKFA